MAHRQSTPPRRQHLDETFGPDAHLVALLETEENEILDAEEIRPLSEEDEARLVEIQDLLAHLYNGASAALPRPALAPARPVRQRLAASPSPREVA